jgi:protocatechuate 3,4-dioxygenase beta subunit
MKSIVLAGLAMTTLVCALRAQPASLHGRVLDPAGNPAARIAIEMNSASEGSFRATSEEDGTFSFSDLRPGTYTLRATPEAKPRLQDGERIETAPTYFPSVIEEAEAKRITVAQGADLPSFEIRLRTAPVHRVRGVVLDPGGKAVEHTAVLLFKPASGPLTMVSGAYRAMVPRETAAQYAVAITDENGAFEFPSVLAGDWRVSVEPGVGGLSVGVANADIDNIEIHLSTFVTLDALTDWGGTPAPAGSRIPDVTLISLDEPQLNERSKPHRFEDLVPGRYLIVTQAGRIPGYYLASVFLGGHDVTGQEVELAPGAPPLKIVYKNDGGTVKGTVAQSEHAVVLLIPKGSADSNSIFSGRCGSGGAFAIEDVPPGDYYAAAFEHVDLSSPGFMSTISAKASQVHVAPKSAATVDLGVIP